AYAGVCITEGGLDVDAAITLDDLTTLLERRNVRIDQQEPYFSRLPEERRRHWSTAGGLPLELLREESHASKRFRQVRGRAARAVMGRVKRLRRRRRWSAPRSSRVRRTSTRRRRRRSFRRPKTA